jgi:large subunit ribosomal protein L22
MSEKKKIHRDDLKKLVDKTSARLSSRPDFSDRLVKTEVTRELGRQNLHAKQSDVRRYSRESVHDALVMKRFKAKLRYARISERKMRLVTDQIRGKDVNAADSILKVSSKRAAYFHRKLIQSALANATFLAGERRADIDVNRLTVTRAEVLPGPMMKRTRPSSERRPYLIRKKFSHLLVELEEREPKPSKRERSRQKSKAAKAPAAIPPAAPPAKPESKEEKK